MFESKVLQVARANAKIFDDSVDGRMELVVDADKGAVFEIGMKRGEKAMRVGAIV